MYRPRRPVTAQQTVTVTAAVVSLTDKATAFVLQNDPASAVNILIGDATNQYIALVPGASINVLAEDLTRLYVKTGSSTATLNVLGMA